MIYTRQFFRTYHQRIHCAASFHETFYHSIFLTIIIFVNNSSLTGEILTRGTCSRSALRRFTCKIYSSHSFIIRKRPDTHLACSCRNCHASQVFTLAKCIITNTLPALCTGRIHYHRFQFITPVKGISIQLLYILHHNTADFIIYTWYYFFFCILINTKLFAVSGVRIFNNIIILHCILLICWRKQPLSYSLNTCGKNDVISRIHCPMHYCLAGRFSIIVVTDNSINIAVINRIRRYTRLY